MLLMAHDGQDMTLTQATVLPDLLALTADAIAPCEKVLETAKECLRATVTDGDRISGALIEQNQTAAHGLAWLATYVEALRQMQNWAEVCRHPAHLVRLNSCCIRSPLVNTCGKSTVASQ
jgi:(2S)-methylsuccinyl-CoA dehydrogenase